MRKKDGGATVEPTRKDVFYTVFYFITYCSISVYGVVRVKNDTSNFNVVPKIFVEAECVIMILLKLLTVALAFVLRRKYSESLNIMSYIDVGFQKAGVLIDYRITFRSIIISCCIRLLIYFYTLMYIFFRKVVVLFFIMLFSVMVRSILMLTTVQVDFVQQIALFIAALIKSLLKYQFITLVLLLHSRFKTINR